MVLLIKANLSVFAEKQNWSVVLYSHEPDFSTKTKYLFTEKYTIATQDTIQGINAGTQLAGSVEYNESVFEG